MPSSQRPPLAPQHSSILHYTTFPTTPPTSRGKPLSSANLRRDNQEPNQDRRPSQTPSENHDHEESPLPKKQLAILAVIALAEQTALNSISPYLPDMASSFPEVKEGQVGLYVGLIASSFALAQFATNFFWGWLSDRIGRKPVVLTGTFLTACCFIAFGCCRTLWQAILVQVLMGLVNGNQGVISTCLGEITDRSNQSKAFTYLPVVYGIGGITGPLVGGLLVRKQLPWNDQDNPYPYLAPNLLSAGILLIDFVLTIFFLEESLDEARDLPPIKKRVGSLFAWLWQFTGFSHKPSYLRRAQKTNEQQPLLRGEDHNDDNEDADDEDDNDEDEGLHIFPEHTENLDKSVIFKRDTILLLATFLIFQLANISYNSLYPIFAQEQPPTGRGLSPEEIGLSLGFSGLVTIIFQVGLFGKLREKLGNKTTYRIGFAGFVVAFILMPFVGQKDGADGSGPATTSGKAFLWAELGGVLIIKTVCAVGCLTSALLLVCIFLAELIGNN